MEVRVYLGMCYILFLRTSFIVGGEPKCSKFVYDERMLEKMIRTEVKVEQMKADIEKALQNIEQFISDAIREAKEHKIKVTEALDLTEKRTKEHSEMLSKAVKAAENAMEKAKEDLRVPTVLFKSTSLADVTPNSNVILKFQTTMYNFGNGYDNNTGVFTAPVNGTYLFTAQLCGHTNRYACYGIYVGDALVTKALDYDSDGGLPCNTADALVLLKAGDNVFLKSGTCGSEKFTQDSYRWNTFSGVLLNI